MTLGQLSERSAVVAPDHERRRSARGRIIDATPRRTISRFIPPGGERTGAAPVLLVPPLAAPASCYDLRDGCSFIDFLLDAGRTVYLLDYGEVAYADRALGMERWITELVPTAIESAAADSGHDRVHVAGWSMGGQLSALTAAHRPDLPIASLTTIASPFDYAKIPLMSTLRKLDRFVPRTVSDVPYRLLGGVPGTLVRKAFQLSSIDRQLLRPWTVLTNRDDADFLRHLRSVDKFTGDMTAYPGRVFLQIYHHYFRSNALATGILDVGGQRVELSKIDVPLLVVSGSSDLFCPHAAAEHLGDLVSGPMRAVRGPGGHLGIVTGRGAKKTTWAPFESFITESDPHH